jgi:hypothetical protein
MRTIPGATMLIPRANGCPDSVVPLSITPRSFWDASAALIT